VPRYVNCGECLRARVSAEEYPFRQSSDRARPEFSGLARAASGYWLESRRPTFLDADGVMRRKIVVGRARCHRLFAGLP